MRPVRRADDRAVLPGAAVDFEYSRDQTAFRELATGLAGRFEDAYWQQIDEDVRFPHEFWDALTAADVLGLTVAERYGGADRPLLDLAIVAEALAEGGAGLEGAGLLLSGPVFGAMLVGAHGDESQASRYLPKLIGGEVWAGAFTEPDAGSNMAAISTRAVRRGDRYVLSGRKTYISMVPDAHRMVILARTEAPSETRRTGGLSLFVLDLPNARIDTRHLPKMGCNYMQTCEVAFDDVEVPVENRLGAEGEAWRLMFDILNPERIVLAAGAIGAGTLVLRRAVEYAKIRTVWGGQPIGAHQGVQFPLAEASMRLSAARLKMYEAARLHDLGSDRAGVAAATARYLAVHAALEAADRAIQTFGGAGYLKESGVERHWRNLRLNRIAPLTDEMTLAYVAQSELRLPRSY